MRAWELYEEANEAGIERYDNAPTNPPYGHKPTVSLRHINKLKKIQQHKRDEFAHRKILMGLMYGAVDEDQLSDLEKKQDEIDLQKKELELTKLKQEILTTENEWQVDIHRLAKSGIKRKK